MLKYLVFILTLYSMGAKSYLHPVLEDLILKSTLIDSNVKFEWEGLNENKISCRSLKLRLSRISELEDEIKLLEDISTKSVEQHIAHELIKTFILKQESEMYNVLFDKSNLSLSGNLSSLELTEEDNVILLMGGDVKILFLGEDSELHMINDRLIFNISNYQACMAKNIDFFVLRKCGGAKFSDLNYCLTGKIDHYVISVPEIKLNTGRLRRVR